MGVRSDLIIADLSDVPAVVGSVTPIGEWEGFTFNGLDNVKLCTLLSLLRTGDESLDFDRYLGLIEMVGPPTYDGPLVYAVHPAEVADLAVVAGMDEEDVQRLVRAWGSTQELEDWSESDVAELLREIGGLADKASLGNRCLILWQGL
jgi:hypothetical protein